MLLMSMLFYFDLTQPYIIALGPNRLFTVRYGKFKRHKHTLNGIVLIDH